MRGSQLLCLLAALAVSPEAAAPASARPGRSPESILVGGVKRTYVLHLPSGYDGATALPLVLMLHGHGGTGAGIAAATRLGAKADAERFIAVFPNALGEIGGRRAWNTGLQDDPGVRSIDDVGFIIALIEKLQADLRVDPSRIYVCGFSNGATMTYRLGAELSDKLAAIGVSSGSIGNRPASGPERTIPTPAQPLPVIHFHGKKDPIVKYDGSVGRNRDGETHFLSVADTIAFWVKLDGCVSPPRQTTAQNGNLVRDDYDQCSGKNEVVLYGFGKGAHEWPSPTNNDHFSATDALWEFFARHPRQ